MPSPVLVVVTRDLLAIGRIESAAAAGGWEVVVTPPGSDLGSGQKADLIVIDLDEVGAEWIRSADLPAPAIGFFSHIDEALGQTASEAGIKAVRRGRFWRDLGALLSPSDT
jgi:hypothetical protein